MTCGNSSCRRNGCMAYPSCGVLSTGSRFQITERPGKIKSTHSGHRASPPHHLAGRDPALAGAAYAAEPERDSNPGPLACASALPAELYRNRSGKSVQET